MPYITVTTTATLTKQQKEDVMSGLGRLISCIPGKTESSLMVSVSDGTAMYFRGEAAPCAYIHVVCFGPTPLEARRDFNAQAAEFLARTMGIPLGNIYLTFSDRENWGSGGSLL